MATWIVEVRVPAPNAAWTQVKHVPEFSLLKDTNALWRATITVLLPSAAVDALLIEKNEVRIRESVAAKEWFRGRIKDITKDQYKDERTVTVYDNAVLLKDVNWPENRSFPAVPASSIADELAGGWRGEPRAKLVLYWDMETLNAEGNMEDLSGSGNHGVETIPAALSKPGKWGLCRDFSAGNFSAVDAPSISFTSSFSLSAWVNFDTLAGADRTVIAKLSGNSGWQFLVYDSSGPDAGKVGLKLGDGAALSVLKSAAMSPLPVAGEWFHLAAVFNDVTDIVTIYFNGGAIGTFASVSLSLADSGTSLLVGQLAAPNTQSWDGKIDEVHAYARRLTPAEITQLAGRSIMNGHFTSSGIMPGIGFRAGEISRLTAIDAAARAAGAEWKVTRNGNDQDVFNFNVGPATPLTDSFRFGKTAALVDRKRDSETLRNDVTVLGKGAGNSQLTSRAFHATTIRNSLAGAAEAGAASLVLVSAASFPTSGIVYVGIERIRYSGKSGNDLTGLTRAYASDGPTSEPAYRHEAGIPVFLHADESVSPAVYYTPENPQTGSSIQQDGLRRASHRSKEIDEQNALDALAGELLDHWKTLRESLVLDVVEETLACDLGDTVDVLDTAGAAYGASPYRVMLLTFHYPGKWTLHLGNFRDTLERRIMELVSPSTAEAAVEGAVYPIGQFHITLIGQSAPGAIP